MAAVTKITGANGIVNIAGTNVNVSDFQITLSRGAATQARVGKYSDRKTPGKVDVSGSLTLLDITGLQLARLMNATVTSPVSVGAGAKFTLYGEGVLGADSVRITAANCFFTSGVLRFADADTFIDGPMEFTMEDPDTDLSLTYT